MWLIVTVVVVGALAYFWFFVLDHRTPVQVMEAEDGSDALKRWARTAYCIVNGKFDPGSANPGTAAAAKTALQRDWSIGDAAGLQSKMTELSTVPNGNVAWDHIRRIIMSRMAAAAGFHSQDDSWREVAVSQRAIQGAYQSWPEAISAYREGLSAWCEGDEERLDDFDFNVKEVSVPLQAVVSFR